MRPRLAWIGVLIFTLFFTPGCRRYENGRPVFEYYTVGFSTPEKNEIWVRRAVFDRKWSKPVGTLGCCWQESGKASAVHNRPMPLEVYLEWIDESDQLLYTATVKLDPDTGKKALALPGYTLTFQEKKENPRICLIIGMREDGRVDVWLSNARYKDNVTGRVLETVGQAQATSKPWVLPNQKPPDPPMVERVP